MICKGVHKVSQRTRQEMKWCMQKPFKQLVQVLAVVRLFDINVQPLHPYTLTICSWRDLGPPAIFPFSFWSVLVGGTLPTKKETIKLALLGDLEMLLSG